MKFNQVKKARIISLLGYLLVSLEQENHSLNYPNKSLKLLTNIPLLDLYILEELSKNAY